MATRTLYLCYFGLKEPLVQTQVLPYLRQLRADNIEVYFLTFEPHFKKRWTQAEICEEERLLAEEGIHWFRLPYHKRPSLPATLYDISAGARFAARLMRREKIEILHARSHIAAAMGAIAKRSVQAKLLFDIRGFFPEEYVDAGVWPKGGYLYRGAKAVERRLFKAADAFVVLTESARTILFEKAQEMDRQGRPVEVIPCCVDLRRFEKGAGPSRKDIRRKLNLTDRRVIVYVGALGGWYLTKEMAELLAVGHRQDEKTFSLILTQSPPEMLEEHLRRHGVSKESYLIRKVAPVDVPCYLRASDIALSFIKPCYSKLSSSPTKIAEYLASGLPVICNSGIGDVDEVIEEDRVGVLVNEFNAERYLTALQEITVLSEDRGLAGRCRASAVKRFDLLSVGGARYRRLYRRLYEGNAKQEEERDGELKN